ncbi:unnamed protein product [Rotaria magnacalcarata]
MTSIGDTGEQTASQATNRPTVTTNVGIIKRWRICNSDNLRDEFFCPICLIWVALAVAVEKAATIFLDRELRKIIKRLIGCLKTRVKPLDYHTAIGTAAQGTR